VSVPRFFIPGADLTQETITLDASLSHRISRVLRLKHGDEIHLLDNTGLEVRAVLTQLSSANTRCRIVARYRPASEPTVQVTLFQALLPRQKFEWVLEKGTEIGVSRFVPLLCQRNTAAMPADTRGMVRKLDRWRSRIRSAAEQSHRSLLPEIEAPVSLSEAVSKPADMLLMAWEQSQTPLRPLLHSQRANYPTAISLFVGPEGGFTRSEADQVAQAGGHIISLGPRILRSETAGIVLAAVVLYELDDWRPTDSAAPSQPEA